MVMPGLQDTLVQSQQVAEQVSSLGTVLAAGDASQVDAAVQQVLLSYDAYASSKGAVAAQPFFDTLASATEPLVRAQGSAGMLASVLLDLEMAAVLGETARIVEGEAPAPGDFSQLQVLSADLVRTSAELQLSGAPGTVGFSFDEVLAAAPEITPSADLPQAVENFAAQAQQVYTSLLEQTTALLKLSFAELDRLDLEKVLEALKQVFSPLDALVGESELARRAIDALKRAVLGLRQFLGESLSERIEAEIKKILDSIKAGDTPTQVFLKYSYGVDPGMEKIKGWLQASQVDLVSLDAGSYQLAELNQRALQVYAVHTRIVKSLRNLDDIFLWLLKKGGVGAPLDLLLYGVFLVIMDIAVLQGMDYADTTTLVKFVDGVLAISQRVLAG